LGQRLGVVVGYEGINKGGNMHSRLPLSRVMGTCMSRVMGTCTGNALDLPRAEALLA